MKPGPDQRTALADELLSDWEAEQMRPGYRFLPARFVERVREHERAYGPDARAELLVDVLLNLLDRRDEISARPYRLKLVRSIDDEIAREHERMRREYASPDARTADLGNDLFLKDLGVAAMKLLPAGCNLVDINQGVPRSTVIRGLRHSVGHGAATAAFILARQRGFRPALETHMSLKRRDEFTPEGRRRCFVRLAELLDANPKYLGLFATSWYYDPALAAISPHLAFVRDDPAQYGARFTYIGVDESMTRSAIGRSATRRALFEQGKYRPCAYMMIWPRRNLSAYKAAVE